MNVDIDISNVVLTTKRLTLRAFLPSDLEDFYNYAKVDGVGQMAGWLPHKNIEESKRILDMFIQEKKTLAIVYENKVIGSIGIEKYDEEIYKEYNHLLGREIGYVLAKEHWGRGLMPEAVKEVIHYLFNEVGLDFIACGFFKSNVQSNRVQQKVGFKYYKDRIYTTRMNTKEDAIANIMFKGDYYG